MKSDVISSTWVVWSLGRAGRVYRCDNCSAKMFVRYASGLCPWCWNGEIPEHEAPALVPVPHEKVLAGVLDDPAIEA